MKKSDKKDAPKVAPKPSRLATIRANVSATTRTATDPRTAILAALASLKKAANAAKGSFVTAAEKKKAGPAGSAWFTHREYVGIIDDLRAKVEGTDNLGTLKPLRQSHGQALYYGARVIEPNGLVGFGRVSKTGWKAHPEMSKYAGVFSSRIQKV